MQVTHNQDHVTHAVIGGKQTINFGISDSPEFFNILSSTLYKNQKLAVAREVLCNAWDAHIASERTNLPVEVTSLNNQIVIRDFGYGIPTEDIGQIYGVYGASTKKNDGNQTGGFGLGCKAPFAYTDHFQVVSCNKGVKTIYAVSKSSAVVNGKPGITPIVSTPTKDSGLTVTIQMKSDVDLGVFVSYIKRIAFYGDMFVTLNGGVLPRLEMGNHKHIITPKNFSDNHSRIHVRYGNVIYPIERCIELNNKLDTATKMLERISSGQAMYFLILQAEPHTIAVTPSREMLSMQEHTIKTLDGLLTSFLKEYQTNAEEAMFKALKRHYSKQQVHKGVVAEYLSRHMQKTIITDQPKGQAIYNTDEYVDALLSREYPKTFEFRHMDLKFRIEKLIEEDLIDKKLAQSFLDNFSKSQASFELSASGRYDWQTLANPQSEWFYKFFLKTTLRMMMKENMDIDRLYVCDSELRYGIDYHDRAKFNTCPLRPVRKAQFAHPNDMLPYLTKTVVLSTAKTFFKQDGPKFVDFTVGSGFLVYHVGMKKADIEKAREFWAKTGMNIIDICDEVVNPTPRSYSAPKPRKKGYPVLKALYDHGHINTKAVLRDDCERIEEPEFWLQVSTKDDLTRHIPGFRRNVEDTYMKHFGHLGCVTNQSRTVDTMLSKNIPFFGDYLANKLDDYIRSSPTIWETAAFNEDRFKNKLIKDLGCSTEDKKVKILRLILNTPLLRDEFKIKYSLTDKDKDYLRMLPVALDCMPTHVQTSDVLIKKLFRELEEVPLDPICDDIIKAIDNSPVIDFLDVEEFSRRYRVTDDPVVKDQLKDLFITMFNL